MDHAKYINPYTDFGFKKLFGEEGSKDLLIDFLNELLPEKHKITDLTFKNPITDGHITSDRKAIFDIHCTTRDNHRIIVEMQKAKMKFFKDRTVFYTSFPIRDQAQKGDWDFELTPVYCVAILDFEFEKNNDDYLNHVHLKDQYHEIFYDKLSYIYIEMPRFDKKITELESHFEKWLYFLKHLEDFETIPEILQEPVFEKGFKIAELANYTRDELAEYEASLMIYRDLKGVIDTSYEEGMREGIKKGVKEGKKQGKIEGKIETARNLLKCNVSPDIISKSTGLSVDEIEKLT